MKVAVIGAGLIGERRARIVAGDRKGTLVIVVDVDDTKAKRLARELGCESGSVWEEAVRRDDVDLVVAATPNNLLAPVSVAALNAGKHVLCEKPMATRLEDAELMIQSAETNKVTLGVGYTLRHHPAVLKAKELLSSGAIGEPMFIRAFYGHGGRPG